MEQQGQTTEVATVRAAERRGEWIAVPSPIGELGVAAHDGEITTVHFGGVGRHPVSTEPAPVLRAARDQFDAYFAGDLTDFDLPLAVPAGSDFETAVWKSIAAIGYGDMATYGAIAAQVGDKDAARAVGIACNRNPLPIIVPCHRVVGAGGKLVGFGGGLDRKRFLLALEARVRMEHDFA
jgi:methylated-DNA-[protein]-cysteine S-methyltransferase